MRAAWIAILILFSAANAQETPKEKTDDWISNLEPLANGGWVYFAASVDSGTVAYITNKQLSREGQMVFAWIRWEYKTTQYSQSFGSYKSSVSRNQYDCKKLTSGIISLATYKEWNLGGEGNSYVPKDITWTPVIPGTMGESLLEWACHAIKPKLKELQ